MIYYFSGTGNSKWVAEALAALTDDSAASIPSVLRDDSLLADNAEETKTGLVFPIYAWGVPEIVKRFCGRLHAANSVYPYVVCTCGDEAGIAVKNLKRLFPYISAWSIAMPNNYIPMFNIDGQQIVRKKIETARGRIAEIAKDVMNRQTVYDVNEGNAAWIKTTVACPAFNAFAMRTKPFFATDDCNGCGLCEKNCPADAIEIQNGKPVWVKKHCTQCMSCINRCPQRAIEYGKTTKTRERYYFHEEL